MEDSDEHAYDKAQYPILLKQYYLRLFPYEKYYQWLSYSEGKYDEQAWSCVKTVYFPDW